MPSHVNKDSSDKNLKGELWGSREKEANRGAPWVWHPVYGVPSVGWGFGSRAHLIPEVNTFREASPPEDSLFPLCANDGY